MKHPPNNDIWGSLCKGVDYTTDAVCIRRDTCARYIYNLTLEASGHPESADVVRMWMDATDNGLNCGFYIAQHVPPEWWDTTDRPAP